MLQPQVTPTSWAYGVADTGETTLVMIHIGLVTGDAVVFVSPSDAHHIAAALEQTATDARAKDSARLLLPPAPGGLVSPNGAPLRSIPTPAADADGPTDETNGKETNDA